jgi:ABC-type uncharacterized transport system fused permease/ATPase subunit
MCNLDSRIQSPD